LGFGHGPFAWRHSPFFLHLVQHEKKKLQRAFVGGEMGTGPNRSLQFGIQGLNRVGGVGEGYLDPVQTRGLWREQCSSERDWTGRLWNILMFQAWLLPKAGPGNS
jgi:asparagine synthase (glutamine-hydrolysing)